MTEIGIGIVGGGYMGKAHAVAMSAVGAVFDTQLRPRLEMICASSAQSAEKYRKAFGVPARNGRLERSRQRSKGRSHSDRHPTRISP